MAVRRCFRFVWLVLLLMVSVSEAKTVVHDVRLGLHRGYTRLVLECEGEKPAKTYRDGHEKWIVSFKDLQDRTPHGKWEQSTLGVVRGVRTHGGADMPRIQVVVAETVQKARIFTLPGTGRHGNGYRLVMDFFTENGKTRVQPQTPPSAEDPGASPARPPQESRVRSDPQDPVPQKPGVGLHSQPGDALAMEAQPEDSPPMQAETEQAPGIRADPDRSRKVSKPIVRRSPYDAANAIFELQRQRGFSSGEGIERVISSYEKALRVAPDDPQKPLALYRLGLCYRKTGKPHKAKEVLQQLVDAFGSDPVAARAWLLLGELAQDEGDHVNALAAFDRAAQRSSGGPESTGIAYLKGISLLEAGNAQEARSTLQRILEENTDFYLKAPEIFRYMGEAAFALKEFPESRRWLFRYLNVAPSVPDKDLVLARLAETYLQEGNRDMADKLFAHIEAHYPGSEGDLVGRIRKAEFYESQGPDMREEALLIYRDLAALPLPEPLGHFVQFKLAYADWQQGRYRESLAKIDSILQESSASSAFDEFRELRERVVVDWARRLHEQKDYKGVIELYNADPFLFQESTGTDMQIVVAESFEALRFFPNALALYESLLEKKPEDRWRLHVARCAFEMGELDKAWRAAEAIKGASYAREKEEILGRICATRRDYPGVLEHIGRIVAESGEADPVDPELLGLYAEAWHRTGQHEKALVWCRKALGALPKGRPHLFVSLSILASRCHLNLGRTDKALELLEQAIPQVDSEDLRNQLTYQIGMLFLETGKEDSAEKTFSELLTSPKEFWKMAARQQLDYLKIKKQNSEIF
ncbi:MAG: tetratricopeptide repeat protein [Desulfacinum sp.]|nr:tetratricopeptide repeat protein [Desulfacinum sp.]